MGTHGCAEDSITVTTMAIIAQKTAKKVNDPNLAGNADAGTRAE
jgi:hypothetical protein